MGKNAPCHERFTQYNRGNMMVGAGQRIGLFLTYMPMQDTGGDEATVVSVRVLAGVRGSDHLPVEAVIDLELVNAGEVNARALGAKRVEQQPRTNDRDCQISIGTRILVKRSELQMVAAREGILWIPATVKVVSGQLVRVRVDNQWLLVGARREQGVTIQGIRPLIIGEEPARFTLGDEVVHFRSKKPGTVVAVSSVGGTQRSHKYEIQFEGTITTRTCTMAMIRAPDDHENLTPKNADESV